MRNGDEVICFDPSYDSYAPAIALSGGIVKRIALQPPHFRVDWQEFAAVLSERTRLVILNTPHNPSATVWQQADFSALWQAIGGHEIFVISDEVYEHINFSQQGHASVLAHPHATVWQQADFSALWQAIGGHEIFVISDEVYEHINFSQQGHASVLAHPQLRERAVAVSSFGKTYHMTGWKVGYCVAPAPISAEIRKVHQYLTFSVNTPAQLALADMLRAEPEHYLALPDFYRQKRDILVNALNESRLEILPCEGTYFLLVDYSAVSTLDDVEFCQWLTQEQT